MNSPEHLGGSDPGQPDQPYNELDPRARKIVEIITTDPLYPWEIDEAERKALGLPTPQEYAQRLIELEDTEIDFPSGLGPKLLKLLQEEGDNGTPPPPPDTPQQ